MRTKNSVYRLSKRIDNVCEQLCVAELQRTPETSWTSKTIGRDPPPSTRGWLIRELPAIAASVLSGVLLGVTYLPKMSSALAPLGWFWMFPILFVIGPAARARRLLGFVLLGCFVLSSISTYGLASPLGRYAFIYYPLATIVFTCPFIVFVLLRSATGVRLAVYAMPLIWVCVEWLLRQVEVIPPFLVMAVSQDNAVWLVQFADLFGEWGIGFWLVLFNVTLYLTLTSNRSWRGRLARAALAAGVMVAVPSGYSALRLYAPAATPWYHVLLVQPNPTAENMQPRDLVQEEVRMTYAAVERAKPDLIVWPEGAVPYALQGDVNAHRLVARIASDLGTPLVIGAVAPRGPRMGLLRLWRSSRLWRPFRTENAAFLMLPGPPGGGPEQTHLLPPHEKRRLVPFIEAMPYATRFSWLRAFYRRWHLESPFTPGHDFRVFEYADDAGRTIRFAPVICWEELYAGDLTELVRRGAQFFTVITSDIIFGDSPMSYEHASLARLRAMETHRPVIRATTTGVTMALDAQGRQIAIAPGRTRTTLAAAIAPAQAAEGLTLYVRRPNLLPQLCGAALVCLAVFSLVKKIKERRRSSL